ncbi:hypothetical protein PC9H_008414 [Pleurotus ostreatus]|uniref:Uncharacterized protein n=1 Tax=Pleurotus ostreatus TaxID=5322 RepID=A0A8H6ZRA2_PLEOS|nr:uncharacterized protein PC9H_008414 [Pleurotus ostreatus]KAF7426049.1 hypothetical protein PC9H_008414 [Pleurotus ostreatus]
MPFDLSATSLQLQSVVNAIVENRLLFSKQEKELGDIVDVIDLEKVFDFLTLVDIDTKGSKRLCVEDEVVHTPTELQVRMFGVLVNHELPPRLREIEPNGRIYARQHVAISGLGAPFFTKAIEGLQELAQYLTHFFKEGSWAGWSPSEHLGFSVLDANSRYYTLRSTQLVPNDVPFPKDMDPRGLLERGKGTEFAYSEDNVVEYWKYNKDDNSYTVINPREFKDGDIVEVHVSFLLLKMSTSQRKYYNHSNVLPRYRMLLTLRGLTLLAHNEHKDDADKHDETSSQEAVVDTSQGGDNDQIFRKGLGAKTTAPVFKNLATAAACFLSRVCVGADADKKSLIQ